MGVSGLWDLLSEGFDTRVPFEVFISDFLKNNGRPVRIAVDGYGWIVESATNMQVQDQDNIPLIVSLFMSKVRYLLKLSVSFIIVFDGKFKPKFKRNFETYFESAVGTEDYWEAYNKILKTLYDKPETDTEDIENESSDFAQVVRNVKYQLNLWNVSYLNSPGEGEAECAYLQSSGVVDYVMSNDVDCLMFGATKMLRNFSKFIEDKPNSSNAGNLHDEKSRWVTPVRIDKVEEFTGFNRWRLLLFAVLNGSDYGEGVKNMGPERAKQISLIGSSQKVFYTSPKKRKIQEDDNEEIPDFSEQLKLIYTSELLFENDIRIEELLRFKKQLKHHLISHPFKIFKRNLSHNTFTGNSTELEGFPSDEVILALVYPLVNYTNVFKFTNEMANFAEDTKELLVDDDLNTSLIDFDHIFKVISPNQDSSQLVHKVKLIRNTGVNKNLDYFICKSVYKYKPLSNNWIYEYSVDGNFQYFNSALPRPYCDSTYNRFNIPNFDKIYKNLLNGCQDRTKDKRSKVINNLDETYLIHHMSQALSTKSQKQIFFDTQKVFQYPDRRKNIKYCQDNNISHSIELLRISYNKESFFGSSISRDEVIDRIGDDVGETSYIIESEAEEETRLSSPKKRKDPNIISVWIPKEIANYYVPSLVKKYETDFARENPKLKRSRSIKKTKSWQKTTLDSFGGFIKSKGGNVEGKDQLNKSPNKNMSTITNPKKSQSKSPAKSPNKDFKFKIPTTSPSKNILSMINFPRVDSRSPTKSPKKTLSTENFPKFVSKSPISSSKNILAIKKYTKANPRVESAHHITGIGAAFDDGVTEIDVSDGDSSDEEVTRLEKLLDDSAGLIQLTDKDPIDGGSFFDKILATQSLDLSESSAEEDILKNDIAEKISTKIPQHKRKMSTEAPQNKRKPESEFRSTSKNKRQRNRMVQRAKSLTALGWDDSDNGSDAFSSANEADIWKKKNPWKSRKPSSKPITNRTAKRTKSLTELGWDNSDDGSNEFSSDDGDTKKIPGKKSFVKDLVIKINSVSPVRSSTVNIEQDNSFAPLQSTPKDINIVDLMDSTSSDDDSIKEIDQNEFLNSATEPAHAKKN
ncbi:crossover junction endodeoxyribonuclease [Saccharomycopsis crataegensis]|uniref:Crossover junction endodeoxyribonuclease n=1 Tax=Saccharomycopsis crataegensis TaxID=43959 RepID=A0AAV5QS15_9ASCO|nr:crossover junction endodeoxyribonuclease [Saccharomycopsis crataegensis]